MAFFVFRNIFPSQGINPLHPFDRFILKIEDKVPLVSQQKTHFSNSHLFHALWENGGIRRRIEYIFRLNLLKEPFMIKHLFIFKPWNQKHYICWPLLFAKGRWKTNCCCEDFLDVLLLLSSPPNLVLSRGEKLIFRLKVLQSTSAIYITLLLESLKVEFLGHYLQFGCLAWYKNHPIQTEKNGNRALRR